MIQNHKHQTDSFIFFNFFLWVSYTCTQWVWTHGLTLHLKLRRRGASWVKAHLRQASNCFSPTATETIELWSHRAKDTAIFVPLTIVTVTSIRYIIVWETSFRKYKCSKNVAIALVWLMTALWKQNFLSDLSNIINQLNA